MRPAGALAIAASLLTTPALAYRTAGDLPEFSGTERVRWATPLVSYARYGEPPPRLTSEGVRDALIQAFAAWSQPACSALVFDNQGVALLPATPGDGANTVQWLSSGWSALGAPPDSPGLTDVQYEKAADGTWRIVEADLYLNAEHHSWVVGGRAEGVRDLLSVATHEAGHMLGLLHPCELAATGEAPDCDGIPIIAEATMFPVYSPEQATLSADDEAGVCFLYPAAGCDDPCPDGTVCQGQECVAAAPIDSGVDGCATDDDCPGAQRCDDGGCRPGDGQLGDPCIANRDCALARCAGDGHCAQPCQTEAGCGDAGSCDTSLPEPVCTSPKQGLGATCSESNECLGDQCLAGLTREPVCTRLCGTGCPEGWECAHVDNRDVCAPIPELTAHGGGGCVFVPQQRASRNSALIVGVLVALALRCRLRRVSRKEE